MEKKRANQPSDQSGRHAWVLGPLNALLRRNEGPKPPTAGERIMATYNAASRIFAEAAQFDFDSPPGALAVNVTAEDGKTYAVQYNPQTENGQGEIEISADGIVTRVYKEKRNAGNYTTMAVTAHKGGILDGRTAYRCTGDSTMQVGVPENPGKKEVVSFTHLLRGETITHETRKINLKDMEVVDPALQAIGAAAQALQKQRPSMELTDTLPQQIEELRGINDKIAQIVEVGDLRITLPKSYANVSFYYYIAIQTDGEIRRHAEKHSSNRGPKVMEVAIANDIEFRDQVIRELNGVEQLMQAIRTNMPAYAKSLIEPPEDFKSTSSSFMGTQHLDALTKAGKLPAIQAVLKLKLAKMQSALMLIEKQT